MEALDSIPTKASVPKVNAKKLALAKYRIAGVGFWTLDKRLKKIAQSFQVEWEGQSEVVRRNSAQPFAVVVCLD